MGTVILQFNCGKCAKATADIGHQILAVGYGIALLQEPYAVDGSIRGLPATLRVFADLQCNSAIVVNLADADCVMTLQDRFGVCISVERAGTVTYFGSLYCKFSEPLLPYIRTMDRVLLLVNSSPVVLGLDANASSTLWHSKANSCPEGGSARVRGDMLAEWCLANNMFPLNQPSEEYTFDRGFARSDIDVTLGNLAFASKFWSAWQICRDWGFLDHNPIRITIGPRTFADDRPVSPPLRRWLTMGVDWARYGILFSTKLYSVPERVSENSSLDFRALGVTNAAWETNDELLRKHTRVRLEGAKWWTPQLSSKRSEVNRLRRRYQNGRRQNVDNVSELFDAYRAELNSYKRMLRYSKNEHWRCFVQANRDDPWGRVYRLCRNSGRHDAIEGIRVDGSLLSTWSECARELMMTFFPRTDLVQLDSSLSGSVPPPLAECEVANAIALLRAKRSPGLDGITGEMVKAIWKVVPSFLVSLYADCISEGCFPNDWKVADVVILLKSPDKDRTSARSYRGICLLPVLGKVLERIMVDRLQRLVEPTSCPRQFGFKAGYSTGDAWQFLKNFVGASGSRYVLGIFVDFKGAFDNLLWTAIMSRLRLLGCQELKLWHSYFSGRRACVRGANSEVWVDVVRGCPQGSISGPFIWNMMMDVLLHRLEPICKFCAYADDLLLLIEGSSRAQLERIGGEAMEIVDAWGREVGVVTSADKTAMMLLKGRLSVSRPPVIHSRGVSLGYATSVVYLGVAVGERMNFMPHLSNLKTKISSIVGKLARVTRVDWGLSRRAVRIMYGGLYVACATYGAWAWYDVLKTVAGRQKLLSCQRVAILGCLPVCRTVSTDALQVLMGAVPWDLEVLRVAITFCLRRGYPIEITNELDLPVTPTVYDRHTLGLIDAAVTRCWQSRWDNSTKGRVTYAFIRDVTLVNKRRELGLCLPLGFLLTGHGSLNAFLYRRGLATDSGCSCGAAIEDWRHVLLYCPLYADIRAATNFECGDLCGLISSSEALSRLDAFARRVFARRRIVG